MINYIKEATNIKKKLHATPERSMAEVTTKKILMEYLQKNNDLEIIDRENWFYARYIACPEAKTLCLRADYDAVTTKEGISRHLCGHDGHAAALAAFGKWISDHKPNSNIILLFQPGEETGQGALLCRDVLRLENIDEIYAFHNIPGYPEGSLLLKNGTFACASTGIELCFHGTCAHAAYPENGHNPALAMAELIVLSEQAAKKPHKGMVLSTVIGIDLGSESYGVSASEGTLRLTVRAEYNNEFEEQLAYIRLLSDRLEETYGLTIDMYEIERFPSTENHPLSEKLAAIAAAKGIDTMELQEPFRWSEDFGWYLQEVPGMIFGIGAGEDCPPLHDAAYEFNDNIFDSILNIYAGLV